MYEAHITFRGEDAERVKQLASIWLDWKFSKIDGDPNLGSGVKCYLTRHMDCGPDHGPLLHEMIMLTAEAGIPVLRQKIEKIIMDTKTKIFLAVTIPAADPQPKKPQLTHCTHPRTTRCCE